METCSNCEDGRVCTQEWENSRVDHEWMTYMAPGRNIEKCKEDVALRYEKLRDWIDQMTHVIEY